MAEDQVPRKLAYEQANPGATILGPDRNNPRWRFCFEGRLLTVRGHDRDLGDLMDYLEEAEDPRVVGADPLVLRWRTGRHVSRHLYAQLGDQPANHDPYIGTVETAALATEACAAHNERLAGEHGT
jgi:hypothetical protein